MFFVVLLNTGINTGIPVFPKYNTEIPVFKFGPVLDALPPCEQCLLKHDNPMKRRNVKVYKEGTSEERRKVEVQSCKE